MACLLINWKIFYLFSIRKNLSRGKWQADDLDVLRMISWRKKNLPAFRQSHWFWIAMRDNFLFSMVVLFIIRSVAVVLIKKLSIHLHYSKIWLPKWVRSESVRGSSEAYTECIRPNCIIQRKGTEFTSLFTVRLGFCSHKSIVCLYNSCCHPLGSPLYKETSGDFFYWLSLDF